MLKKILLGSIALSGLVYLNPAIAGQAPQVAHSPVGPSGKDLHPLEGHPGMFYYWEPIPCPVGSEKEMHITGEAHHVGGKTSESVVHDELQPHKLTEMERNESRNPQLSVEEEALRIELEAHGIGSLYERHGKKEFGKEYSGDKAPHGVYFKQEPGVKGFNAGRWILDSSVTAKGLSDKNRPTVGKPKKAVKSNLPAKPNEGIGPDVVGLSQGRVMQLKRNPQTGKMESSLGAVNRAQTGLTGAKEAPHVDTSETGGAGGAASSAAVPPPPPPPPAKVLNQG
jgi:hypothetical protein